MDKKSFHDTAYNERARDTSIEIAEKLKELNTPIETIIKSTGLSKEEIEKI